MSRLPGLLAGLLAGLLLTGCSGADEEPESTEASASGSPSATTTTAGYLPVPDEVSLTTPGTELKHGESATVAWELPGGEVGVLDLAVERVREVRRSVFAGWLQDDAMRSSTPYFVDVTLQNRGSTDLGGEAVPLYLLDDNDTLGPPWTFGGRFAPCASGPLPRRFLEGEEAELCLVYLAPRGGEVETMTFDPVEDFDAITWEGKVSGPPAGSGKDDKDDKGR
jgi:hypothetical protein